MPGYIRPSHMRMFKASLRIRKVIVHGNYYSTPAGNRLEMYEWLKANLLELYNARQEDIKCVYDNTFYGTSWSSWSLLYLLRVLGSVRSFPREETNTTYLLASPALYMFFAIERRADGLGYLDSPYNTCSYETLLDEALYGIVMYLKECKHNGDTETIALARKVYEGSYLAIAYNEVFPEDIIPVRSVFMSHDYKIKIAMEQLLEDEAVNIVAHETIGYFINSIPPGTESMLTISTHQKFGDYIYVGQPITEHNNPFISMFLPDTSPDFVISEQSQARTYEADNVNDPDA